ncbi:lytic transglycosylase domain-containing protein [Methylotenera sp.]|uniref:lytic transglycosylase domain-containing protein n=1 Tax=Methylotenera sp. TaxID=2051956 RepID=UPI0027322D0F|nr:lytic transglycosylase domain-containing protein [Methylotenera sp.]MDP3004708.1 lytic transglycosylase domain-containing protein [Methylotenera sp.]
MILDTITIQQCAPMVDQQLMMRVISVESSHNPYAIGVVNGHLQRQPQNITEAKATAQFLENAGYNYSVGLAQVNRSNFSRFKLNFDNVFDVCANLNAGGQILRECLNRARAQGYQADATHKALSCYYSGQLNSAVGTQYANKVLTKLSINTRPANNKAMQISAITADKPENAVVF